MTKIGYEYIIERILEHPVIPPQNNTVTELGSWLLGYSACMNEITDLIRQIENENSQH